MGRAVCHSITADWPCAFSGNVAVERHFLLDGFSGWRGPDAEQWAAIDDGDRGSRMLTDYHHLIVGKNPEITDDLSSQSHEFQFEYLDDASLLARSGKVKKGFSILEAHRFTTEARR